MVRWYSPLILRVYETVPVRLVVELVAVVGLLLLLQQQPRACTVKDSEEVTVLYKSEEVLLILLAVVVVTVGETMFDPVVKVRSLP